MGEPVGLGEALSKLAARIGMERPFESARLVSSWSQIVGSDLAGRCEPVSLKEGVLVVRAESAAWGAQLRYLAPSIIARIGTELGEGLVTEVRIAGSGPSKPAGSKARKGR